MLTIPSEDVEIKRAFLFGEFLDSLWAMPRNEARSGALRAEPVALSQAKPPAAIAKGADNDG